MDIKELRPYIQRADEMEAHDPKVAYYCRMWAVLLASKIPKSPTVSAKMNELLEKLEATSASVPLNQQEDAKTMAAFAVSIFENADRADRAGQGTLQTAGAFYAASIFLDSLRQFNEDESLSPDLEQKQRYAVWKAADIRKALREGRVPTPGGAVPDDEALLREAGMAEDHSAAAEGAGAAGPSASMASPPPPPPPPPAFAGAASPPPPPPPPVFPGAAASPPPPPPPPLSVHPAPLDEWAHLRPTLPDMPAHPPAAPAPSTSAPLVPPSALPPMVQQNPLLSQAIAHVPPPPPPPSLLHVAPVVASPTGSPYAKGGLDPKKVVEAKKEAKNAASALDFDDVTTAIQCLQRALGLLQSAAAKKAAA